MRYQLYFLSILSLLTYGCASGPTASSMIATVQSQTRIIADGSLVVGAVNGGKETNPMLASSIDNESFREALYKSLQSSGLFPKTRLEGSSDYSLDTEIISQEVKSGINTSATILVRYELYKKNENKVVWSENIFSQHEALFEETFYGVKRAQLANEGVVKDNITQLILELRSYIAESEPTPVRSE